MNLKRAYSLCILLVFLLFAASNDKLPFEADPQGLQQLKSGFPSGDALLNAGITYRLTQGINHTWGYDILVDNKMTIHQPSIPGLPGNDGFKTREGAENVAKLVVEKMKEGEMPPAVTEEEMKKLQAI